MKRRHFLKNTTASGIALMAPFPSRLLSNEEVTTLTILHTNDLHSRIEPFPATSGRYANLGGAARRANLIEKIRKETEHSILLDSGDIFQGTPYFNFFGGELEVKLMEKMQYDATTIGNHDFDNGLENLAKLMGPAKMVLVNSNYRVEENDLYQCTKSYHILQRGPIKIGLLGVGIELEGLVPKKLYGNTEYRDPIIYAQKSADFLKEELKCDLIICLSHLGYQYRESKVSDVILAHNTRNIDIILGGHTHTLMDRPDIRKNLDGEPVIINQVGWAGIMLGRLDITFEKNRPNRCLTCKNLFVQ